MILDFLRIIFYVLLALVSVPVITLLIQVIISLLPYKNKPFVKGLLPKVTILIPAHNESTGIIQTLLSINAQVEHNVSILVVADNCNDDTAQVARQYGAEVIERFNDIKRGKGYALDFGIQHLKNNPPEIVLVLDADCLLAKDAISTLVVDTVKYKTPIQGLYLMYSAIDSPLKAKIAEFAWVVKNWVRPLGFYRLGLSCQLMGSGMAFPWVVISQVNLASGHIVEDMKLGVDLAKLNLAPRFCPEALITSQFPTSEEGVKTQRTRWEHGHIGMIIKEGPFLFWLGIKQMNIKMLSIALDMCVPPLALLILGITALSLFSTVMMIMTNRFLPWGYAFIDLFLVGIAVMLAWYKFGKSILSFSVLLMAPIYVLVKIPLYIKFIFKRQSEWVRSKRDS